MFKNINTNSTNSINNTRFFNDKYKKIAWLKTKTVINFLLSCFLLIILLSTLNGCARWPDGGGGDKKNLLVIRVDISENGKINTEQGKYYVVLDTQEGASTPPSGELDDWKENYYYIKLDNFGSCSGRLDSTCKPIFVTKGEKYFQVNLKLENLGNPKKIFMNVVTTDKDDKTYDSMGEPSRLTVDTSIPDFSKIETDITGDSEGGPDFDIIKVTLFLL